jgi:hypothetical protein
MILKKEETGMVEIDLTGPDGNVFYLMGVAKKLTRTLNERRGNDFLNWRNIQTDMMSDDYEHAIDVLEENFGHLIILYR